MRQRIQLKTKNVGVLQLIPAEMVALLGVGAQGNNLLPLSYLRHIARLR